MNFRYHPEPQNPLFICFIRQYNIATYLKTNQPIEDALKLPFVNNMLTTHSVVMILETRVFLVAFNNGFAASDELHKVIA